ncbi:MAG TPA: anti-sigma factor [Actinomycetota bacterium]|nr:anti-sigma factor [Actinomycetota bacterium]
MTHDELRELVPVYALDALDAAEELEVRRHVETCDACRATLEDTQVASGALALAASPVAPPPALRDRVLQAARSSPQAGAVVSHSAPREHRLWRWVTATVAVAAVVVAIGFGVVEDRHLHTANREVAAQRAFISSYISSPVATAIPMVAAGSELHASAQVYVSASGKSAGLVATGLTSPGTKVYQVWLIVDNQPSPVAAFRPDAGGVALVPISADLSSMQGMAVTLEARAGNKAPKGPKVLQSA